MGLALLSLLAFLLRLYRIDWQSLWVDENFTVTLASRDVGYITWVTSADVHPPLYYYLVHFWVGLTGQSELALRFLSVLLSVLVVPLTYKLGALLLSRRAGIIAALLAAIAPFQVYYAQEARMYSLMTLLALSSTYMMARLMRFGRPDSEPAPSGWRGTCCWAVLALSSAGLMYAHYFGALVLVFQSVLVLITRFRQRDLIWRWILSQVAVAVLFAPWIPVMARTYVTNDEDWRRFIPFLQMFQDTMVSLSLGRSMEGAPELLLAGGFFLALLVGVLSLCRRRRWQAPLFLGLYLFLPIAITFLMSITKPVYGGSRYLIFVAPAFYLLVAEGLMALRRWKVVSLALLAFLVLASGSSLADQYWNDAHGKDDYRGLARLVESKAGPGDGLVVMNGLVFEYYYRGELPRVYLPQQYPMSQDQVLAELNRFSQGKARLWMLRWDYNGLDPDDFIWRQLDDHARIVDEGAIRALRYTVFQVDADTRFGRGSRVPLGASFEDKLTADSFSLSRQNVQSGRDLEVTLDMRASTKLDRDYRVSVFLTDATGYRWAQEDRSPTGYSTSRWRPGEPVESRLRLPVPLGMPPGEYQLGAVVYSPGSLEALNVLDSQQRPLGASLGLGKVQVERGALPYPPSRVSPSHPLARQVLPEIGLLGYDLSNAEAGQGDSFTLALYWQALARPQLDYSVTVQFLDEAGHLVQEFAGRPNEGRYPSTLWGEGEIVRDVRTLQVPASAPPGRQRIAVSLDASAAQVVELDALSVTAKSHNFELPPIEHPAAIELGEAVTFRGYEVRGGPLHAGSNLDLTLFWQARAGAPGNLAVFTHLLDAQNRIWAQHDGAPDGGAQPTSGWVAGQVIADRHELAIKGDAPAGEYVLEVGMYDPRTATRLKLPAGEDRILLGKVSIQ